MNLQDRHGHDGGEHGGPDGGQETDRDRKTADQLTEPGEDREQHTGPHPHLVEETAGSARAVGREELGSNLGRHELLQAVAHEKQTRHQPKNEQSDIHVVAPPLRNRSVLNDVNVNC